MKPKHTVPYVNASIIAPIPDLIDENGGDVDRVFFAAGITPELSNRPDLIIPLAVYLTLLEASAREIDDEHFGLSIAERLDFDKLGPFGRLTTGAATLCEAIATCCDLIPAFSPALKCLLSIEGDTVSWHYRMSGVGKFREGRRIACELTLFLFRELIRLATGPNWQPREVLLEHSTAHQHLAVQNKFGAPIRSVGGACGLVFQRSLLDLPMIFGKPLGEVDRQTLLLKLRSTIPEATFAGSAKAIIRSYLTGGYPEISAVARAYGMSVRSFQRRLDELGLSYSSLVSDVRFGLARNLLDDTSLSQIEISYKLGYSGPSSFSRAFKKWSGKTPSEFRHAKVYDLHSP